MVHQAPLSMGFPRQESWSGLPFPPPGDLSNPGIEAGSPTLQADSLCSEPPGMFGQFDNSGFLDTGIGRNGYMCYFIYFFGCTVQLMGS